MNFNLKCQFICFNKAPKMQVHLGKSILQYEKSVEDLGLTVQSDLSSSQHIEARFERSNKFFHQIQSRPNKSSEKYAHSDCHFCFQLLHAIKNSPQEFRNFTQKNYEVDNSQSKYQYKERLMYLNVSPLGFFSIIYSFPLIKNWQVRYFYTNYLEISNQTEGQAVVSFYPK